MITHRILHFLFRKLRSRKPFGFSTVETSMALGIVGVLASTGVSMMDLHGYELTMIQQEFQGSMFEAFNLARAQGKNVIVALGDPRAPGIVPVPMPPHVKWGKPADVPVPAGMEEPKVAGTTGSAHPRITVTPRHTVTACAWFVNDGKDVVCMRVSGRGHLEVLRWHHLTKKWSLC